MSGKEVSQRRIALNNEIDRIATLVKGLKFQEAEESLPQIDELFNRLVAVINQKIGASSSNKPPQQPPTTSQ